jgi:predicted kinase
MKNQNKFDEISKKLFSELKYIKNQNQQLIIAFSGVPGSGKSELSKKLGEKYSAIRIGNDTIRDIINHSKIFPLSEEKRENLLQDYNEYFVRNYPFRNKLLILDKSMDRQYKRFFPVFKELGLEFFIIRLTMDKEGAIERIMKRKKGEDSDLVEKSMERWQREFLDFGKNAHYDILINGEKPDFEKVCEKIDKILS